MEKTYWLSRKRASLAMARKARSAVARLVHYDLAGRYSVNAAAAEASAGDKGEAQSAPLGASRRKAANRGQGNA